MRSRRTRQIALILIAAAVLLGVNVPPAFSYVQEWRYERLINSQDYKRQFGHWDTILPPEDQRVNSIHAALLPNGKVLLIAGSGNKEDMFATKALKSLLYDPATGQSKMIPVPDDMFCGGQTLLPDGRLLVAGGTARYEKLDGAVTNAAGAMRVKNENPNGPRSFPAGTEFVSPEGIRYRTDLPFTVPAATKVPGRGGRVTVTSAEEKVFVEAENPGPQAVTGDRKKYSVAGLSPLDAQNIYGLGEPLTLDKQDYQGTDKAFTFDANTEQWSPLPDMNQPRWYPSLTPMNDGRVLTTSGLDGVGQVLAGQTEMFDPRTNQWIDRPDLFRYFPTYPAIFQTEVPGRMVYTGATAGYGPSDKGRDPGIWNLNGNVFTPIPGMRDPNLLETAGSAFVGPVQDQRIAVVGGGGVGESPMSTSRIDFLDLKDPAPHFVPGPNLREGTRYPNLVNLPDDTTLITNGSRDYRGKGATNNHLAQVLDPTTNTLRPMADPRVGRDYHTESLLLPDGRVLVAGSDPLFDDEKNTIPGTFEQRVEIFTPPYLYQDGPRPSISSVSPVMNLGQTVDVPTPDADHIRSARLIKAATATHVTTVDMRSVALDMRKKPGAVSVTVPRENTIVPPGQYMLFFVDDRGVPSEGKMVTVPPGPNAGGPLSAAD